MIRNELFGAANMRAKRLSIREDCLSAPLIGMSFHDRNWAAVMLQKKQIQGSLGQVRWSDHAAPIGYRV